VGHLEDGTRIYFGTSRSPFGTFAELAVTRPELTIPLPEELDDTVAAAAANPGMSSW
jgi:NADPH:quinone reductase-like Zn-dependent oxidoreductase